MEGNGTRPTIQLLEATERGSEGQRQRSEEVAVSEELAMQKPSLPAKVNPCQQQGAVGTSDSSQKGSGGSSSSGFDADIDDTVSVASSADLLEAYDSVLEALDLGNQRERNTMIWIDKCLERVASASSELRNFATGVLSSSGIGSVNVQSTISEGDNYRQRFQAVDDYLLAAFQDLAVRENARMVDLQAEAEETEGSSEEATASGGSTDFKDSAVVGEDCVASCGEASENRETVTPDEDLLAKFKMLKTASDEGTTIVQTDAVTSVENAPGEVVKSMSLDVTSEDVINTGNQGERKCVTKGDSGKKPGVRMGARGKDSEDCTVRENHREKMASGGGGPEEVGRVEGDKRHAGEEAFKRAHVIRKLVIRQRDALSRMTTTAETRVFRLNSVCQFLLTCVKCATCVCSSALNAHGVAQLALQVAESSGTADIVDTVREAAVAASDHTNMAVASCEQAAKLHRDAASILEEAIASLNAVQDEELLGEATVRDVTSDAENIRRCVDRGDISLDELASKLSLLELVMDSLSRSVKRVKDVNRITEQLAKKFDDSAFQIPVVAAVVGTTQFALSTMAAAKDALAPLSGLKPGAQTGEPSVQESTPGNLESVGHGNAPDEAAGGLASDPQKAAVGRKGKSPKSGHMCKRR